MRCPYWNQANVKLCGQSAHRTMIVQSAGGAAEEKCSTPAYTSCPICQPQTEPAAAACPYLATRLVEYCAAAPVRRFVACDEPSFSRCKNDSYRYCDLFLGQTPQSKAGSVSAPARLYYSPNHMWFDPAADGCWHVGIDDLLARVLGPVDRVTFVAQAGFGRPAAILSVNGLDCEVVFPDPLRITGANQHLRAEPGRLTAEPYTRGWLFEGRQESGGKESIHGLLHGRSALPWMLQDMTRMAEFAGGHFLADGGTPCDMLRALDRERALQLFHEFFSLARVGSGK
jgi:glycine cleavage system H lipoate-binding protein